MRDTNILIHKQRREFLHLLGRAGLSAAVCRAFPLIGGLMATRRAEAQASIKRVVFVYTPNGAPYDLWLPSGSNLNRATAAYEGLQAVCNFREVEVLGSGHGNPHKCMGELRYTSDWTSDSIDQQIASVIGTNTPYASYALGVETGGNELIGRKSGAMVPSQDNPEAAYQQLFGGASAGANDRKAHNQSILDLHRDAVLGFKNQLGAFERQTLEEHEAALLEIEKRLDGSADVPSSECIAPPWNAGNYPTTGGSGVPFAHQSELQSDIMVAAMKCGITNVMTLQLSHHEAAWYGHDTIFKGDHHHSCHAASAEQNAEMVNYLSRCVAYLVRRLVEEDDPAAPGTKMIDNTVVVQVTDMGNGQDHTAENGPNMVATRMPSFTQGTSRRVGTHYQVLEAVVEGLGLGAYKGMDVHDHKIWPCAGGKVESSLLA